MRLKSLNLSLNKKKILWRKEKMLVTTIFSFSNNIFYPSPNKIQFLIKFTLSYANASSMGKPKILSIW